MTELVNAKFRRKYYYRGRRLNRVGCPKKRLKNGNLSVISFEECKICSSAVKLEENGVWCDFECK